MPSTCSRLFPALLIVALGCGSAVRAQPAPRRPAAARPAPESAAHPDPVLPHHFQPEQQITTGAVTTHGQRITYRAIAGTLVVHPKGWDDVSARLDLAGDKPKDGEHGGLDTPEASMFFVAYLAEGAAPATRPITFLYNGGPGSSTVWLHMGAFGPRRVATPGDGHVPAAPYALVDNAATLLDASDLVFIDAPGAGFSRIAGPGKEKAFYGVDQDAHAFAEFITQFLTKYGRWNSPKYLFGESYGTTRSAVLIDELERDKMVAFNGVILLSQTLDLGLLPDDAEASPGDDLPYELALPTYAATAWYHHKLGTDVPKDLPALVAEVEHFASTDYALALGKGAALAPAERDAIAQQLHRYTGLPVAYILKARLRITGGEFEKTLQDGDDTTTGRLDTRFSGPSFDPLGKEADYDPLVAAIGSAYVTAFNDYARRVLHYGADRQFFAFAPRMGPWDMHHRGPGGRTFDGGLNVLPDLATAMKYDPNLHVLLNAGYFDLATPFYEGVYEMAHLPIPEELQKNIELRFYPSGHMVYANEAALHQLHDNVAAFIRATSRGSSTRR